MADESTVEVPSGVVEQVAEWSESWGLSPGEVIRLLVAHYRVSRELGFAAENELVFAKFGTFTGCPSVLRLVEFVGGTRVGTISLWLDAAGHRGQMGDPDYLDEWDVLLGRRCVL